MVLDLALQVGNKVSWAAGKLLIVGVVLEDHGEGEIEIMTHFRNGSVYNQIVFVNKKLLKLVY